MANQQPDPQQVRRQLLADLAKTAEKLPQGLLTRLVADAEFFHSWNMGKKSARKSGRVSQHEAWKKKADDKYWKQHGRFF